MIQFLKENFERNPDLTFIEFRNRKYSNKEFLFQVIHSACILKSYKIPPKGVIGIQISNPFKFLIQWFACNFLGLTSVLLSPKLNGKELQKCLDSTQLKIIITTRNLIGHYSNSNLGLVFVEDSPSISLCGNELDKFDWDENDTATIIFTSGSDGFPKPVELTTANFKSSFNSWNHEIQFDNDKIINFLPLHHIAGISAIFRGLLSRTPIYLMDKFHIDDFIECCKKFNPTIVSLVLKVVYNLFKTEDGINCLKSFRMILVGGGPSNKSILERCLKNKINIFVTYGMTETSSGVSGFWPKNNPDKLHSVGMPFAGLTLTANHKSKEFSQICIIGEMVAKGYLGKEKFNHEFKSGDFGKFDNDGFLFLKPLRKDRIVTAGENVNPIEIENVILEIQEVKDCCVIGIEDSEWGEKILAFVTNEVELKESEILDYCKRRLLEFKIPKQIFFCEELPRNELGKINRELVKKLIIDYERT